MKNNFSKELKRELDKLKRNYDGLRFDCIYIITQFMLQGTGRVCVFEFGTEVKGIADGGGEFEIISLWLNPDNEVEYHTNMDAENNYIDCAGPIAELDPEALLTIVLTNIEFGLYTFVDETFDGDPEDLYDL